MKTSFWRDWLDNWHFKLISLVIALVLWVTVLGRRDFVFTKVIDIELLTAQNQVVVAQTSDRVRIRVSGPRSSLKKFMDSRSSQSLQIDISQMGTGVLDIDVPVNKIEVPVGVRVLGIRPNVIQAEVTAVTEIPKAKRSQKKDSDP